MLHVFAHAFDGGICRVEHQSGEIVHEEKVAAAADGQDGQVFGMSLCHKRGQRWRVRKFGKALAETRDAEGIAVLEGEHGGMK